MNVVDVATHLLTLVGGSTGAIGIYKLLIGSRIDDLKKDKAEILEDAATREKALREEREQIAKDAAAREKQILENAAEREKRLILEKGALEKKNNELDAQWRREVAYGAKLFMAPRKESDPPPKLEEIPDPDWDERSKVHDARKAIWKATLDEELERYTESEKRKETPPQFPAIDPNARSLCDAVVIEDNRATLTALTRTLERLLPKDWKVAPINDPILGRSVLIADPRIKLAVVDYLMPKLNGDELVAETLEARPNLRGRIIICSGVDFPPDIAKRLFEDLGCLRLDKPVNYDELVEVVRHALGRKRLPSRPGGE